MCNAMDSIRMTEAMIQQYYVNKSMKSPVYRMKNRIQDCCPFK